MTDPLSGRAAEEEVPSPPPRLALGGWSFYFIAKLLLFWRGLIGLHPLANLALLALLSLPLRSARLRALRNIVAVPAAVSLLYYDSFLPPFNRLWSQAHLVGSFSPGYLVELAGRFIQWELVALLVLVWVVCRVAASYLRLGVLTAAVLCAVGLQQLRANQAEQAPALAAVAVQTPGAVAGETPQLALEQFFEREGKRSATFKPPAANSTPFDLIFIHICSLSWDDLQTVGLDQHPVLKQADLLFHHFNSAASYSGPAAIRLMRGPCGQQSHTGIYAPPGDRCALMPGLEKAGFTQQMAMNHDGHFDDFIGLLRKQGLSAAATPLAGVPAPLRAFDDSAVYDDGAMLNRWATARASDGAARVALYYNTISLHDGNHFVNGPNAGKDSSGTYRIRAAKLLDDIGQFMTQLERSGRRAVVVVVPEHGAAVRGDKMQVAGLRDIPTPALTNVPVAIKVIGPGAHALGGTVHVNDATSYLALSHIVSAMLDKPPFDAAGFAPSDYLAGLPLTPYVAENEGSTMLEYHGKYMLKLGTEPWKAYDPGR